MTMTEILPELLYSESHEWVRKEEAGTVVMGVTDHAQQLLGDVVFVELPELELTFNCGEEFCVIESVKAAADAYIPVSGLVLEVNDRLTDKPELINESPYFDGWVCKLALTDETELDKLMDAQTYKQFVEDEQR
jgi:glycine cleavage system H protein